MEEVVLFNSQRAFNFLGIIREVELLPNDWYFGRNLMRNNPLTRSEIPVPQHILLSSIQIIFYSDTQFRVE